MKGADLPYPSDSPTTYRLTRRSWGVLGVAALSGATLLVPGWQPQPHAAALAVGVLLALAVAWWRVPRSLRQVRGEWVLPRAAHALAPTIVGARLSSIDGAPPLQLLAWLPSERKVADVGRLGGLPAAETSSAPSARITWAIRFPKRGLQTLPPLSATTFQPFGLISATAPIGAGCDLLVFPALGQIRRAFEQELQRWLANHPLLTQSGNDELAHLRSYRPGDHPHSVHWKASARRRSLLVMERHSAGSRRLALVLDTNPEGGIWRVERLISVAATLVDYFCAKGWALSIHGPFAPEGMHGSRERMLEELALAKMEVGSIRSLIPEREPAIVLSMQAIPDPPPFARVLTLAQCEELITLPTRVH